MERKNKIMLAAAIGAVLVLVASSVVQCALVRGANAAKEEAAEAEAAQGVGASQQEAIGLDEAPVQEVEAESGGSASTDLGFPEKEGGGAGAQKPGDATTAMFALDALRSHAWQAEGDAETTIAFKDGTFVETNAEGAKVTAFEVTGVTEGDDQGSIAMKLVRDGMGEELDTVVLVEGKEGEIRITSDGFRNSKTYVQAGAGAEPVGVAGVTEPYTGLIDDKTDELASAVATYCRDHVPTATEASFDGEVFLDVNTQRVVATFHCNDKASTILSVTYADGAFSVMG